jgi:uncharacterized protein YdbL (DUF1318 family)
MIRRTAASLLAVLVVAALAATTARADELGDLKERFATRYPALLKLREAGKVGETYLGHVEAVKEEFLKEEVQVGETKTTVKDLLAAESKDRKSLYEIVAKKTGTTPEKVAARNALRNFEKAGPEEWLKTKDGWVKKKDLHR